METQEKIIELLESTGRKGIDKLITELTEEGFFEAPASTRFHGSYAGGLAKHSLRVYELVLDRASLKLDLVTMPGQKPLPLDGNNVAIAALLHDICKVGAYLGTEKPYKWNKAQPRGHAKLSIERAGKFIKLDPVEEMMIRFHMGIYGLCEMYEEGSWEYKSSAEYHIRGDHLACDEMSKEDSQAFRYGKSLRNAWFHNPICKVMYFCDELATLEEKAEENI